MTIFAVWADVKRKASPEVLKEVGALMKLYQEEVDKLSNRYICIPDRQEVKFNDLHQACIP